MYPENLPAASRQNPPHLHELRAPMKGKVVAGVRRIEKHGAYADQTGVNIGAAIVPDVLEPVEVADLRRVVTRFGNAGDRHSKEQRQEQSFRHAHSLPSGGVLPPWYCSPPPAEAALYTYSEPLLSLFAETLAYAEDAGIHRYEQNWKIAERLWRGGYIVGIITNDVAPRPLLVRAPLTYPPFRPIVRSHEVHERKPVRRIYALALRRANVRPAEAVFFDDKPENVAGAKRLGIKAFAYENPAQLARELRRLGVKI